MHVADSTDDLPEDLSNQPFWYPICFEFLNEMIKIFTFAKFHDEVDMRTSVDHVV